MLIYPYIYAILGYYVMVLNNKMKTVSEVKFLESYYFLDKEAESAGMSYVFCPSSIFLVPACHRKEHQPPCTSELKAMWYG